MGWFTNLVSRHMGESDGEAGGDSDLPWTMQDDPEAVQACWRRPKSDPESGPVPK
jgi:hypothetical protein